MRGRKAVFLKKLFSCKFAGEIERNMIKIFLYVSILIGLSACNWWEKLMTIRTNTGEKKTKTPIARVADEYLYKEDISDIIRSASAAKEDSLRIIKRYIDSWIRKQLFLQDAEKNLKADESEIERKVTDYRNQLLMYAYQKQLIEESPQADVSEEEIKRYYEQYAKDFELKQNIVKGLFLKVPQAAPKIDQLRSSLKSNKAEEVEKVRSYAYSYAELAILNDSVWIDFQDMLANTPFMEKLPDKTKALKTSNYFEVADQTHYYFIAIREFKLFGEISPVEFVQDQIKNILINKKRLEIIQRYENQIFEKAKPAEDYEIFQ